MSSPQQYWHATAGISTIHNTIANRNMIVRKMKFFVSLLLAVSILIVQTGGVFSASALQTSPALEGTIQSITLETYSTTGMTIVFVTVSNDDQFFQTVHISEKTAKDLGLVMLDDDGKLIINDSALGQQIEISPDLVLPDKDEERHPVANALATFFSDIEDLDYDIIMLVHSDGIGFGLIAQALWLTSKLEGNAEVFQALLLARETGNYEDFTFQDGTTPKNWAELRKGLFDGKKVENLGSVMSNQDDESNPIQNQENNKDKNKDKNKEKDQKKDNEKSDEKDKEKTK
jgi:hypothetical protein